MSEEAIAKDILYEIMSKEETLGIRSKAIFKEPPYHLRFVAAAYRPGGAFCEEEKDEDVTHSEGRVR